MSKYNFTLYYIKKFESLSILIREESYFEYLKVKNLNKLVFVKLITSIKL